MIRHTARFVLFAFVACAVAICQSAQADAPPPKKVTTVEGITEYQLDNGVRVLLFPDESQPKVTVALTVFVGSRHEGYGETGMAHLLEHMLFKGTPTHPRVDQVLREKGANYNGTTWYDRTNYYETLPATDENLKFAIGFEADRLVNCFVRREDLLSEMTVVRNEFEQGENSPTSILSQRIWATAFEWHNYGKETIGNRSDIERVPIGNLKEFYRKHYQPDNAMLVVAGRFDAAKALKYANESFGAIPRPTRKLSETYTDEPAQDGERLVTLRRVGEVGHVGVAYHVPSARHPDFAALDLLSEAITLQPSGRLYKQLVETKKAASVSGGAYALHDPSLVVFNATVPKDGSIDKVRDELTASLESIAAEGLDAEDIERGRRKLLLDIERELTDTVKFSVSLSDWAAIGDWRLYFLHRDRLEKIKADEVKVAAQKYFRRNNRTVGVFIPTAKAERAPIPESPAAAELVANYTGRASATKGEVFDPAWANLEARTQRAKLPGGARVALLPKKSRGNEVLLHLTLKFGDETNLKAVRDATPYVAGLMMRGTKKLNYQQFRDELQKHQVQLTPGQGDTGSLSFSLKTKREHLPAALDLLHQVLREPTLPADQLDLIKTQRLAFLEANRQEPHILGSIDLQRRLRPYGSDDVRATLTLDERIARLKKVAAEDVRRVYQDYIGAAANAEISVVGDFDAEATLKSLQRTFGQWEAKKGYARLGIGKPSPAVAGKNSIATPDKENATYLAGMTLAMRDDDPDYPALYLATYALGNGPGSRLWDRVREKEGLSYGVGCSVSASSHEKGATLRFNAICNPENIDKVEKAIREEVDRLLRDGIGDDELAKAKKGYLEESALQRASDTGLLSLLTEQLDTSRTTAFDAEQEKQLAALTTKQVAEAFRKYVDPKKLVIVTAGDFTAKKK